LRGSDPITAGDLAGSTYGNPLIAAGKVTTGKLADGAVTSSKLADGAVTSPKLGASARMWAKIRWDDSNHTATVASASKSGVTASVDFDDTAIGVNFGAGTPDLRSCASVVTTDHYGQTVGVEIFGSNSDFVFFEQAFDSFDIAVFC
jgi:hypothetical protein